MLKNIPIYMIIFAILKCTHVFCSFLIFFYVSLLNSAAVGRSFFLFWGVILVCFDDFDNNYPFFIL